MGKELSANLPDFIIGGAMKCGTSSLHRLLSSHEGVFIPDREVHFFSLDDAIQHPGYFRFGEEGYVQDYQEDRHGKLRWYAEFFEAAGDEQLIGEDSTIYLASPKAPSRIRELLPNVKIIFMLRNPINRTYSHYWHQVKMGRAVFPFEQQLRRSPNLLLRSYYKKQLERYLNLFPREQLQIIVFEQFVEETQKILDEICSFLCLERSINVEEMSSQANASRAPRWHRLQLVLNYASLGFQDRYSSHVPRDGKRQRNDSSIARLFGKLFAYLRARNKRESSYPPMSSATRDQLGQLFAQENEGLERLIGVDLRQYWSFLRKAS